MLSRTERCSRLSVLRHHAHLAAQAVLRDLGDVLAVDQDAPALQVVQAQQQVDDGALAGARAAHQADLLARADHQDRSSITFLLPP
jgi:hypothetical protein